jgi:hypothetical protein
MDPRGPPGRGGEAGGAHTVAIDSLAASRKEWLGKRLSPAGLDGDLGAEVLLHNQRKRAVRCLGSNSGHGGWRWRSTVSQVVGTREAERM